MRWVISPTHLPPACAALSREPTNRAPVQPPGAASGAPVPEHYAAEVRKRVLQLVREHYSGEPHERFGPALAAEHLWTDHDLQVSVRTLRRWMLAAGLWSRRRKRKAHRERRQRKAHFGELVQAGGSHHQWLEGRGRKACLMNFVDDATGVALGRFSSEETTWRRPLLPRKRKTAKS